MTDIAEALRGVNVSDTYDGEVRDAAVKEIERLRSVLSKHAECETMINQELKDIRAKLADAEEQRAM